MGHSKIPADWTHIRAFLATAEHGSLSAGARALGLTQPTLGRQVAALEDTLGVLLFERVGRSLQLTAAATDLLEHARAMGAAAERFALTATGRAQAIDGLVRITASDIFCAYVLPPALRAIRDQAPKLEIDLVAANGIRDLLRREADIAIRHVRPDQPDLIARKVRDEVAHFYAARSYLDQRGRPATVGDLAGHDFLAMGDPDDMLGYLLPLGLPLTRANLRLGSESGMVAWDLARRGFGILPMADRVAAETPEMERVLPGIDPIRFPVWLVTHREVLTSRRIRIVYDTLAKTLGDPPGTRGD